MKKIIIKIGIIAVAILLIVIAGIRIKNLKEENSRLKSNQEVLLSEKESIMAQSQLYKVSDSLNAAKVTELQLSLSEYKKYRKQDLKLIEQLKVSKSDLQRVISSQTETINLLSAKLSDSIRIDTTTNTVDTTTNTVDTLKCFNYKSKWTDVAGCVDLKRDTVELQISNRESLKIVETVKHKRFLGFLWKTNKVKSRQVDVISQNPATSIVNVDYISISGKQ